MQKFAYCMLSNDSFVLRRYNELTHEYETIGRTLSGDEINAEEYVRNLNLVYNEELSIQEGNTNEIN